MSTPYENRVFHHEINTNHNLTRTSINNQHQKYCDKKQENNTRNMCLLE